MLLIRAPRAALAICLALGVLLSGCPPEEDVLPPPFPDLDQPPAPGSVPSGAEAQPTAPISEDGGASPSAAVGPAVDEGEGESSAAITPPVPSGGAPGGPRAVICSILPKDGAWADRAADMRHAIALAEEEVAEQRWRVRSIRWIEKDTHGTEQGAIDAFKRCMVEGAHVIIGPADEKAITAIVPIGAASDTVLIIPQLAAATPGEWGRNVLAITPTASDMGRVAAADLRVDRGMRRAVILRVDSVFGQRLGASFRENFERGDAKVVDEQTLPERDSELWAKAAQKALGEGADALFVIGPREAGEAVASELAKVPQGITQAVFIDWAMMPTVLRAADKAVTRIRFVNRRAPRPPFATSYQERYAVKPNYEAGSAYDAALVASLAVENASTLFFEDVARAARGLRGIEGAFGLGQMIEANKVLFEDSGGYGIIPPKLAPDGGSWIFDEK